MAPAAHAGADVTAPAAPPPANQPARPQPAPADDAARYAEREKAADPAVAGFEGGATLVIAGSTLAVVLLVVLLVILL